MKKTIKPVVHSDVYDSNFLVNFLVFTSILKEELKKFVDTLFSIREKINEITQNVQQLIKGLFITTKQLHYSIINFKR